MTKKVFLPIVYSLLLASKIFAQITFQKDFGIAGLPYKGCVQLTSDGGYILVSNDSVSSIDFNINLIKTNSFGDTLWTRSYGGSGKDISCDVKETSDKGFVITGKTSSFGTGPSDVYLLKTDSLGALSWSKVFHKTQFGSEGLSVVQANDNGYLIVGISWNPNSFNPNARNCWMIRTDSYGVLLWDKTFGGTAFSNCVNKTNDGGFIFSGFIWDGDLNIHWQAYLFKADSSGNIIWRKYFGGNNVKGGQFVQQTSDSGYILLGYEQNSVSGLFHVLLIKTDNSGDTLWTKSYGGIANDACFSIEETNDNGFIICGYSSSLSVGDYDAYLIKTDSLGNITWSKTYGGAEKEYANSVHQTLDGGYIVNGFTKSLGDGRFHTYLIKTDANGNSGCNESNPSTIINTASITVGNDFSPISSGTTLITHITNARSGGVENTICSSVGINEYSEINSFEIFPNPSAGNFVINSADIISIGFIEVYDALGEKIFKHGIYHNNRIEINLKNITNGIYFVRLFDEEKYFCKKLIIEHN